MNNPLDILQFSTIWSKGTSFNQIRGFYHNIFTVSFTIKITIIWFLKVMESSYLLNLLMDDHQAVGAEAKWRTVCCPLAVYGWWKCWTHKECCTKVQKRYVLMSHNHSIVCKKNVILIYLKSVAYLIVFVSVDQRKYQIPVTIFIQLIIPGYACGLDFSNLNYRVDLLKQLQHHKTWLKLFTCERHFSEVVHADRLYILKFWEACVPDVPHHLSEQQHRIMICCNIIIHLHTERWGDER